MLTVHVRADDRAGLHLTVAWPQAGLPESQTVLTLDPLDDVRERVLSL